MQVKNELKTKTNCSDSDELAMLFKNTYPPQFYKELQRFVHRNYLTKQGISEFANLFSQPQKISLQKIRRIVALPIYYAGKKLFEYRLKSYQQQIN